MKRGQQKDIFRILFYFLIFSDAFYIMAGRKSFFFAHEIFHDLFMRSIKKSQIKFLCPNFSTYLNIRCQLELSFFMVWIFGDWVHFVSRYDLFIGWDLSRKIQEYQAPPFYIHSLICLFLRTALIFRRSYKHR